MNKKTLFTAALCGVLTIVLAAPPGFSQVSTSPGKKVAFETAKGVTLPPLGPVLTAQLPTSTFESSACANATSL